MLIYFDESYDAQNNKWMVLGALFNSHPGYLHRLMNEIRKSNPFRAEDGSLIEEKFKNCFTENNYNAAVKLINAFMDSTSWFRAIAVDLSVADLYYFGNSYERDAIKAARRYKKFAELLIRHNTQGIAYATLLVDERVRCSGDQFIGKMKDEFMNGVNPPVLNFIDEVDSKLPQYQVIRICDILTGSILNNLIPPGNIWKTKTREYLCNKIGVSDLTPRTWSFYSKRYVEEHTPKYNVWFWKPVK